MKFHWIDNGASHRCRTEQPVQITTKDWGGAYRRTFVQDMGYTLHRDGRLIAMVYGTVNPDCPGAWFDNIDEARAYVEQQALAGIALNKLTR